MKKQEFVTTKPKYLKKLVAKVGQPEAAKLIGTSASLISTSIRNEEIRLVNELAAKAIWQDQFSEGTPHLLMIKTADANKRKLIQEMCKGLNIKCMDFTV